MAGPDEAFIEASVGAVSAEIARVVEALRVGSIRDEEDFTSQMLGHIRAGLVRVSLAGLNWDAVVLKRQTEEPRIGADFLGVLQFRLPGYEIQKGFLAQAKMAGPRRRIDSSRLLRQATAMLDRTSASYVFLYRPTGVTVVPAAAVVAANGDPRGLRAWTVTRFFFEHFRCFVGDPRMPAASASTLAGLLEVAPARRVLAVAATTDGDERWNTGLASGLARHRHSSRLRACPPRAKIEYDFSNLGLTGDVALLLSQQQYAQLLADGLARCMRLDEPEHQILHYEIIGTVAKVVEHYLPWP
jgi:hypothetical protein